MAEVRKGGMDEVSKGGKEGKGRKGGKKEGGNRGMKRQRKGRIQCTYTGCNMCNHIGL